MLVDTWSQTGLTEDGAPADFAPTMLTFRGDGTWRADSADGGWCTGGYRTREGRLNYWIDASDDPAKVGSGYTFSYAASANTLVLRGRLSGHDRVATFARLQ